MTWINGLSAGLFWFGCVGLGVLAGYFTAARIGVWLRPKVPRYPSAPAPRVCMVIAARNAGDLIEEKVRNCLSLKWPADRLRVIVVSDGSTDDTVKRARSANDERVSVIPIDSHVGKNAAMNVAVREVRDDIVVFTDADALLPEEALQNLIQPFADSGIGGVCGHRVIARDPTRLESAQSGYIRYDSLIKQWESGLPRGLTSNDGKLCAIRRDLIPEIPDGVTDDLFLCLGVVDRGKRFVYRADARAFIRTPSRNAWHELERRRRIVSTSLRGLWIMRRLLSPRRTGIYALRLAINKILRRCMPVFLAALFLGSLGLAPSSPVHLGIAGLMLLGLAFAAAYLAPGALLPAPLQRATSKAFYPLVGNLGMFLGTVDLLRGRDFRKWDPRKTDAAQNLGGDREAET